MPDPKNALTQRRYIEVLLFVIVYITLGYLFKLKAGAYLLIGIPLMLAFQRWIARQPVHKLWIRDRQNFQLDKKAYIIALCLSVFPIYTLIISFLESGLTFVIAAYNLAAIVGAFCAGYCYSNFSRQTTKDFFCCLAIAGITRSSLNFLPFIFGQRALYFNYQQAIKSLLIYIPIAFVVEEVVFRGMLDSHIHASEKPKGIWSAFFISSLWGLWHLPISDNGLHSIGLSILACVFISTWGILLSIFWRRTGNLAVPGFSHAFADAIRDAV